MMIEIGRAAAGSARSPGARCVAVDDLQRQARQDLAQREQVVLVVLDDAAPCGAAPGADPASSAALGPPRAPVGVVRAGEASGGRGRPLAARAAA